MANITIIRIANGRKVIDTQIDPSNIPTTDQAASFPTGASGADQLVKASAVGGYVTYGNLDTNGDVGTTASTVAAGNDSRFPTSDEKAGLGAAPNALSAANPVADKTYVDNLVDGIEWYPSVDDEVNYVKTTAGAPTGTATSGEKCLNTNEAKLYTYTTSWDAGVAVSSGERLVFKEDGDDTSGGSGTYTADMKIYDYNGSTFDETTPTLGGTFNLDTDGLDYRYTGSVWAAKSSTVSHNNTSGLQGGTTGEYYHITANQEAGLDAATAITASNPPQTLADRDKLPQRISFAYFGGFAVSQTDVEFYDVEGVVQRVQPKAAGSIVGHTVQLESDRTAGTLTLEPTIDGTKVTPSDLDVTIDGTTPNDAHLEAAPDTSGLTFTASNKLGIKATSDASWAPTTATVRSDLHLVYNT